MGKVAEIGAVNMGHLITRDAERPIPLCPARGVKAGIAPEAQKVLDGKHHKPCVGGVERLDRGTASAHKVLPVISAIAEVGEALFLGQGGKKAEESVVVVGTAIGDGVVRVAIWDMGRIGAVKREGEDAHPREAAIGK